MILEILAGTELVIPADTSDKMRVLLEQCSQYIDEATFELLKNMLFEEGEVGIDEYLIETLEKSSTIVAENIRALDAALDEDKELLN